MAEQKAAEVKKKGFFSRKKSEPAPAPSRTAPTAAKPQTAPKPTASPQAVEPRLSLESMPEVEKRIDRMHATQRRASLLERYENRYGEKLEVPNVFVPVEEEKAEPGPPVAPQAPPVPAAAPVTAPKPAAAPAAEKPAALALPPKPIKTPEAKPAAAEAKPASAAVRPAPTAVPKPPEAAKPSKPSPINGKSFWKYLWPYWRLPFRALAKYNSPENKSKILAWTILDIPVWIILALPRIVLCPIGLAVDILKKRKAKQASGEKAETVVAAD